MTSGKNYCIESTPRFRVAKCCGIYKKFVCWSQGHEDGSFHQACQWLPGIDRWWSVFASRVGSRWAGELGKAGVMVLYNKNHSRNQHTFKKENTYNSGSILGYLGGGASKFDQLSPWTSHKKLRSRQQKPWMCCSARRFPVSRRSESNYNSRRGSKEGAMYFSSKKGRLETHRCQVVIVQVVTMIFSK